MFGFGRFVKKKWRALKNIHQIERLETINQTTVDRISKLETNIQTVTDRIARLEEAQQISILVKAVKNLERIALRKEEPVPNNLYLAGTDFDQSLNETLPQKIVFIATSPRTGSHLLMRGLESTGATPFSGELLNPFFMDGFYKRFGYLISDREYLDLLFKYRVDSNGVFSLKTHGFQYERFKDILRLENVSHIIFLERKDKISQAISWLFGDKTQQWLVTDKSTCSKKQSINYEYNLLMEYLNKICADSKYWVDLFSSKNINPYYVTYEEFSQNYQSTIAELASWISGREFKAEDIAPPALKIQRDELNQEFKERFIRDLRAHGIDESQYQRLYWPERSRTECR